ncbi:MAG: hypothetical protein FWF01_01200 [Alphaproteobacteria bacterium]|nr:hypothetical protein [Alphaproteobacteria bacterium]
MKSLFFAFLMVVLAPSNARAFDLGELATDVLPPSITGIREETPSSPLLGQNAPARPPRPVSDDDFFGNVAHGPNQDDDRGGFLSGLKDIVGSKDTATTPEEPDSDGARIENRRAAGRTPVVPRESTAIVDSVASPQAARETPSNIAARRVAASNLNTARIAGVRLRLTPQQVARIMEEEGFSLLDSSRSAQPDLDFELRVACRNSGLREVGQVRACVDGQLATTRMEFGRSDRPLRNPVTSLNANEIMAVDFTGSYGGNVSYKITYRVRGDASLGSTREADRMRNGWRNAFYARLESRFGLPDYDYGYRWVWGDENSQNASLQAFFANYDLDAVIIISNYHLQEMAETRAIARAGQLEDQRARLKFRF